MEYLEALMGNLSGTFGNVLPKVLGALVILLIGFFVAGIVKRLARKLLSKTQIDDKIGAKLGSSMRIDSFIAKLFYYLVVIYTLIIVLNLLGVNSVLEPLQDMLSQFIGFLPKIIAAGIITFAGYIIATLVSEATGFISERLEAYGEKAGMDSESVNISNIVKKVVFIIVFIPIFIIALDTLSMKAISEPATEMLSKFLNAIPNIIAAGIVLAVFYFVGKWIVSLLVDLLKSFGLDNYAQKMGLSNVLGNTSLSRLIGNIVLFFIMFTGLIAAFDKLDMGHASVILNQIFDIAGRVFFGLIILLGGIFISNTATDLLSNSAGSKWMVPVVRFAIMGIFLAFALHTMGIAESIVNLAFGLTLGAIAVAFALAFGLGGREAAGKEMQRFFDNMRK